MQHMLSNMPPKVNPLHINGELEAIHKLIQDIKTDLAGKVTTKKLIELSNEIRLRDSKIEVLESKVAVLQNTVDLLVNKCDNNEQYSRRCSLRINNGLTKTHNGPQWTTMNHNGPQWTTMDHNGPQ